MIPKKQPRRPKQGLTPAKRRALLLARDGHVSAWTGNDSETLVPQHRANRGTGGAAGLDVIENLVWLEADINFLVEHNDDWAEEARRRGIKINRNGRPPDEVPVEFADGSRWLLRSDGTKVRFNE